MVRRIVLGAVVVTTLAIAGFAAPGCMDDGGKLETDCDKSIPLDCCLCPLPDVCPPYLPEPKRKLPAWCDQYLLDGGTDGGDAGEGGGAAFCASGVCVPPAPESWKHVAFALTWPELPPACPDDAPSLVFEGSPEPPEQACPTCSCDAPEGSCSLPDTWTVSSEVCPGSSGVKTNFDPPSGWDGSCSSTNAIAQGKLCGGVPCVQSITLSLPVINEQPCAPQMEGWVDLPIPKLKADGPRMPTGRACASNKPLPNCSGQGCGKTNSAFGACILHDGDQVCPDGWTGDRHVLYQHVDDARACTPCGCDAPKGAECKVKWRAFSDSSCTTEIAAIDISTGMMGTACAVVDPGVALAGKTTELLDYTKGSCTPTGGKLVGELIVEGAVTICCHTATM